MHIRDLTPLLSSVYDHHCREAAARRVHSVLYKSATSPTYHPLHTLITPRNHHPTPSQSPIAVQTHDMSKDTIRNSTHSPPTAHPRHFKNPSRNPFTAPSQYKIMTRLTRIHVTHPSSLKKKPPTVPARNSYTNINTQPSPLSY